MKSAILFAALVSSAFGMTLPTHFNRQLEAHPWIPAGPNDSRSPCPALNTLANHGILPHSGRNITIPMLNKALEETYNLDFFLRNLLTQPMRKLTNSIFDSGEMELGQLALHNFIEHDASLAHLDSINGGLAPTKPDADLVKELLADSEDGQVLTLKDWATARVRREATAPVPLPALLSLTAKTEPILITSVFGDRDAMTLSVDKAKSVLLNERFPDDFRRPANSLSIVFVNSEAAKIGSFMDEIRAA